LQNNIIKINQSLHGYSDGHRLLSASIEIPDSIKRNLLVLSDMSGPNMVPGFESYLTGYPLNEVGLYAFAKTWYAQEMRRPGCVWTHTLLLDFSDLSKIENLQGLIKFFIRPSKPKEIWASYGEVLTFDCNFMNPHTFYFDLEDLDERKIYAIISELYTKPDKPIFVPAYDSKKYEKFVFSILVQQWPRLRRDFRFCTGAISNRVDNGKNFDLQICPESKLRAIKREVPTGMFVDEYQDWPISASSDWKSDVIADLETPGHLRKFLWRYGADIKKGREAFRSLTKIFSFLNYGDTELKNLIERIAEYFPQTEDAASLKLSLFGLPAKTPNEDLYFTQFDEDNLLYLLATTRHQRALKLDSLQFSKAMPPTLERAE